MSAGRATLTRLRALALAGLLALLALVAAGCASTVDGNGAYAGPPPSPIDTVHPTPTGSRDFPQRTATPRTTPPRTSASSTPSRSGGSSSSSADPDVALKEQLAQTGESWMHAYASGDVATMCALSDPPSMQQVLDEYHIASCDVLPIDWSDDRDIQALVSAFAIPDPGDILLVDDSAFIHSMDVEPRDLGVGMDWIRQDDGSWKVDASILIET